MESTDNDIRESIIEGLAASPGVAIGSAIVIQRRAVQVKPEKVEVRQVDDELTAFNTVRDGTIRDLKSYDISDTSRNYGDATEILEAQIEIVKDPDLHRSVCKYIEKDHYKADYAVCLAFDQYLKVIEKSGNQLLIERLVDVRDIRDRLIKRIQRHRPGLHLAGNTVVVSEEISATEVIEYARDGVRAIVSDRGGLTSHAVIIANSLGVPAVVGTRSASRQIATGDPLIVDGKRGKVILNPEVETLERYKRLLSRIRREEEEMTRIIEVPSKTLSGESFRLQANVEFAEELGNVVRYKAMGIGLLRTEALLLADRYHDGLEEMQRQLYKKSIDSVSNDIVTIRLFDIGGDKFIEDASNEVNPFLGWRGVRYLLDNKRLLDVQLKAILEMAGQNPGKVRILVPMVSTIEELQQVSLDIDDIQNQLEGDGKPIDKDVRVGIMLEVPSMVLLADRVAKYVDFFSIGTNDLTQYTLAVDRGNTRISKLYQQMHPSLWSLIHMATEAARKNGVGISVCGELAGKPFAASVLLGLGITELSMAPAAIPAVKKVLVNQTMSSMQELAQKVLKAATMDDITQIMNGWEQEFKNME
ncbi:MAG TPA: phosphoenolpyruvate--protein phosphotransferase [Balneolales bacterium]|nr:phosphoenolpyruvate--protein phosphotransferase [Balneolales bacterium]